MPYLGKVISNYDFEIQQTIFRQYLCTIQNEQIYLLRIVHHTINFHPLF